MAFTDVQSPQSTGFLLGDWWGWRGGGSNLQGMRGSGGVWLLRVGWRTGYRGCGGNTSGPKGRMILLGLGAG
jgi:hypothetical protein